MIIAQLHRIYGTLDKSILSMWREIFVRDRYETMVNILTLELSLEMQWPIKIRDKINQGKCHCTAKNWT